MKPYILPRGRRSDISWFKAKLVWMSASRHWKSDSDSLCVPIIAHKEVSDFSYLGSYVADSMNDFDTQETSLQSLKHVSQHLAIKFLEVKGTLHPFALSFVLLETLIFLNGCALFPHFPLRRERPISISNTSCFK